MIGWYVHHQGRGHLHRAAAVAAELGTPVVGLSSLPSPGEPFADWVALADDAGHPVEEVTAGGALHWAPRGHDGMRQRMSRLAAWVEQARPAAVVVDVSVEVSVFLRLMGVPVVVTAMPGDRTDAPHTTGYTVAERVLAFWPQDVLDPPWLSRLGDRVVHVGAVSRFDGREPAEPVPAAPSCWPAAAAVRSRPRTSPACARSPRAGLDGARRPGDWSADPWPVLSAAEVVVTHAGQNALAEVAAARRPAVVVAQERPFREQHRTTDALHRSGIAVGLPRWPDAAAWPRLLEQARALGGQGWARWSPGDAARRAAARSRRWRAREDGGRHRRARAARPPRPAAGRPRRQTRPADDHVVVAMGDPGVRAVVGERARVVDLPAGRRLPLAAARNAAPRPRWPRTPRTWCSSTSTASPRRSSSPRTQPSPRTAWSTRARELPAAGRRLRPRRPGRPRRPAPGRPVPRRTARCCAPRTTGCSGRCPSP